MSEPYGVYATPAMELVAKEVYNMEVRSDDIWIVTFPKCGTTLTQVKKRKLFWFALNVKNSILLL